MRKNSLILLMILTGAILVLYGSGLPPFRVVPRSAIKPVINYPVDDPETVLEVVVDAVAYDEDFEFLYNYYIENYGHWDYYMSKEVPLPGEHTLTYRNIEVWRWNEPVASKTSETYTGGFKYYFRGWDPAESDFLSAKSAIILLPSVSVEIPAFTEDAVLRVEFTAEMTGDIINFKKSFEVYVNIVVYDPSEEEETEHEVTVINESPEEVTVETDVDSTIVNSGETETINLDSHEDEVTIIDEDGTEYVTPVHEDETVSIHEDEQGNLDIDSCDVLLTVEKYESRMLSSIIGFALISLGILLMLMKRRE